MNQKFQKTINRINRNMTMDPVLHDLLDVEKELVELRLNQDDDFVEFMGYNGITKEKIPTMEYLKLKEEKRKYFTYWDDNLHDPLIRIMFALATSDKDTEEEVINDYLDSTDLDLSSKKNIKTFCFTDNPPTPIVTEKEINDYYEKIRNKENEVNIEEA